MRLILLVMLAAIASAGASPDQPRAATTAPTTAPATGPTTARTPQKLTERDIKVLEAAFASFLADPEARVFPDRAATQIVLDHMSGKTNGMIGEAQLNGEFHKEAPLPADAAQDLRARNAAGATALDDFRATTVDVAVADLSKLPHGPLGEFHDAFAKQFPKANAHATIWLPGYSGDGREAIVRFWFGPTPHGATATYVLHKGDDGGGTVVRKRLSYYA